MLLITTPTGNSGRHVLIAALQAGQQLRVLVRDAKKLSDDVRARAEVIEGDMRDAAVLARAAAGVSAAFFCTPQSSEATDIPAYYRSFAEPAVRCFAAAGVERVVTISGGRGNPADLGPGGPLAAMEHSFDAACAHTRHVRCGYFMENFLYMVPQLKFKGSFSLPIDPAYPLAVEAAQDIGRTAARWLLDTDWQGKQAVDVPYGQALSCSAIAAELTRALDKNIAFAPVSGEAYRKMLVKYGVSEAMAQCLKEMFEGIEHESISGANGIAHEDGVTLAEWAAQHLKPEMKLLAVVKRILS